jgi:hypothetical protein
LEILENGETGDQIKNFRNSIYNFNRKNLKKTTVRAKVFNSNLVEESRDSDYETIDHSRLDQTFSKISMEVKKRQNEISKIKLKTHAKQGLSMER